MVLLKEIVVDSVILLWMRGRLALKRRRLRADKP